MALTLDNKCVKMLLPNGNYVDIQTTVLLGIKKWLQTETALPESGGFIVGYKNSETDNISLEDISQPYCLDIKNRINFIMKDPRHKWFLIRSKLKKSYYMGVWHTHPQLVPEPSKIDWEDWYGTLKYDRTGCEYIFFIISGISETRVWVGDFQNGVIQEIYECEKIDDIYQ